jgi:hypothetical protein
MGRLTDRDKALLDAAENGSVDGAVAALLVCARLECSRPGEGMTPLMLAAQAGAPRLVQELLRRGADPKAWVDESWEQSAPICGPTARAIFFAAGAGCQESYALLEEAWEPDEATRLACLEHADVEMLAWMTQWSDFGRQRARLAGSCEATA